tara:strand:- start:6824 stop:14359 length:7536 start_codon:yes stop_codon:yes gene_type:complete
MPIDVQMPDGTIISGVPDNITQADLLKRYQAYKPAQTTETVPDELGRFDAAKQPKSAGFSAKDTALSLGQGVIGAGKSLTDVFGADNAASRALGEVQKDLSGLYTPERKAEMTRREALQKEASKGSIGDEIGTFLAGVAEAPVQSLAQGLGSIVPYVGTGIIGGIAKLGGATIKAINTVVGAAQGTGAVKGSLYDGVKQELEKSGMSEKEAAAKASKAQEYLGENFLDIAGGTLLGAAAARVGVENLLTPGAAAKLDKRLLTRAGKAALAEAPLEGAQGGQEQLAINRALQKQGFDVGTFEGVAGSAARDAAVGALTGATVGGVRAPGTEKAVAPPKDSALSEPPPMAAPPSESQDTQAMIDEFRGTTPPPVSPVPPVPPIEPPPTPPEQTTNIWEGIQNRDRSTPASIAQMTKIANEPDYSRVSMSRDYGTGAPIVAGAEVNPAQLGRTDTVTGADGKKVPIQYGVIEAGEVIPSHNADGTKNPAYVDPSVPAFRAITNGRVAGLQAAYNQGTATDYRNALLNDDLHGIDKAVIEGMNNPMLVRVMPMDQVNANTGDVSNTGAGLSFNIVEQAKNDTNRLDLSTISFTDAGDVSQQTIRDFIKAMPTTEQGNLIDKQGNPTKQAIERVDAAIFQQAYGNDKLTELAFQARDEEARNIVRALNMAASKAIRLADAGDYDVRPLVNEAVEIAINARRNNTSLSDAAKQSDMTTNPMANQIVQMFADNSRSSKAIGENLSNLFDNAYNEGSKEGADMFGEVPKRPVDQLIKDSFAKKTEPDLFAEVEKVTDPDRNPEEPKQFKSKKPIEQIAKEIEAMTDGSQVAGWLVENAPNEAAKAIADRLLVNIKAIEDSGVPIKIEVLNGGKRNNYYGASGLATGGTKNIQYFKVVFNGLNSKGQAEFEVGTKEAKEGKPTSTKPTGTRYSTLMHELLHVISQVQIDALIKRNFKGPEKVIYNELRSIYNAVKDQIESQKRDLPRSQWHPLLNEVGRKNNRSILSDIHELFVRSLTEKNVQSYLSTVNMGKKTALTKLMEVFRKVIGLNPDYQSALDRIMIVSDKIFAQTPKDMQRLAQTEGYDFPTMKKKGLTLKTNTPQFKKWFGNSKITNEDGSPKVLYHITPSDFDKFIPGGMPDERGYLSSGKAIWLSPNKESQPASHNVSGRAVGGYREGVNVMPLYVKMERPLLIDDTQTADWAREVFANGSNEFPLLLNEKTIQEVKDAGYDGIIWTSPYSPSKGTEDHEYVVFDPNQVKSSIGNTGEYSTTDARIQKEEPWYERDTPNRFGREIALTDFYNKMQDSYDESSSPQEAYEAAYEDATSQEKAILRQLQKENFLGFDYPHQAIQAIVQEPQNFELTAPLKAAISRLGNKAAGITKKEEVLKEEPTLKTDTPQFRKWFGNSKITNEDGSPKVMYHGTQADITEFKGKLLFVSPNQNVANKFAADGLYGPETYLTPGANVLPVYVKANNPFDHQNKKQVDELFEKIKSMFAKESREDAKRLLSEGNFKLIEDSRTIDAIKSLGYDGLYVEEFGAKNLAVFEPNQIKSAIGNTGEYSTEVADIRYEEVGKDNQALNYLGKPVEASWAFPEDRFVKVPGAPEQSIDKLLYIFQDKQIDLKRAQEGIAKAAGEITDNINAYDKEQLFHGKVATGIRNFLLNELMPAIKKIKEFKLTTKDMQDYLLARHAEERNNRMNEINKLDPRTGKERETPWELQDRASGMSTDKAREYLNNLDPDKKQSLETIGKMFDKMITGTQKILVESGSESQSTIDAWNDAYEHYMPLFRIEEDFNNGGNRSGLNKGFNVNNPFSKRAMGSAKEVQNIITNLIKQRERALIRAEKLTVTKALYGLFLMNPNPDIALPVNPDAIKSREALIAELQGLGYKNAAEIADNLMAEPKTRYISKNRVIDKDTGLPTSETEESVRLRIDSLARFGDNVLTLRVDGKNRYIFFNQDNPNAVRMAASLKSLDTESLGSVMSIVAKGTRWFANVNTQYNPIFAAVNLIRDIGSAQFNLTTTPLAGKQAQVTAGIFPAMRGIFKILRAERNGEVGGNSDMEKAFREFREAGGQTGYRDALARKESEQSIVDDMLKKTTLRGNALKAMKSVFGALSDFNDTLENSIRLSAYIQASKPKSEGGLGLSKQQAAIIAKNLTVNFDKKGQISANVNALYAFFNASVQGTARLATTLTGPKGKAIIGGGILLGSMQSILLAAAGFKEDEPPEFVKQRNFVIPTPDGNYITIPYPLGFNLLPNIGRITTEFMLSGGKNPAKRAGELIGSVADAFSPIGSSGLSIQTIAPTVLDPLAALESNKDAFGRPIYKEDRATNPTPGYLRSRENASEMSKSISYFFNLASGGTKYSKGFVSPTADEIDYVIGQVTGGLGREIMKTGQTIKAAGTGEDLPAYRVPLLGRFYGETESNAAESQRFYNNITRMADHENEIKGRIKNKESVASYFKDNPEARLYQQANTIENQINALNKQKKEFIERGFPKDRIKRIENQKAAIMKRFNDQLSKFED